LFVELSESFRTVFEESAGPIKNSSFEKFIIFSFTRQFAERLFT